MPRVPTQLQTCCSCDTRLDLPGAITFPRSHRHRSASCGTSGGKRGCGMPPSPHPPTGPLARQAPVCRPSPSPGRAGIVPSGVRPSPHSPSVVVVPWASGPPPQPRASSGCAGRLRAHASGRAGVAWCLCGTGAGTPGVHSPVATLSAAGQVGGEPHQPVSPTAKQPPLIFGPAGCAEPSNTAGPPRASAVLD